MAISSNNNVDEAEINSEADNGLLVPAEAAVVWDLSNQPTYIDSSQLTDKDLNTQSPVTVGNIDANSLVTMLQDTAYKATRIRLALAGRTATGSGSPVNHGTEITSLIDSYRIWYVDFTNVGTDYTLINGTDVDAANLNAALADLQSVLSTHRATASVVDLRVCHSSCHSSCHGSRSRR